MGFSHLQLKWGLFYLAKSGVLAVLPQLTWGLLPDRDDGMGASVLTRMRQPPYQNQQSPSPLLDSISLRQCHKPPIKVADLLLYSKYF